MCQYIQFSSLDNGDRALISKNKNGSIKGGYSNVYVDENHPNENTQWSISNKGVASFNYIKANSGGKIGGWNISSTGLSAGGISINTNGSITCDNWTIKSDGTANFKSGSTVTFGSGFALNGAASIGPNGKIGGSNMGLNSGGGYLVPSGVKIGQNKGSDSLEKYIDDRITSKVGKTIDDLTSKLNSLDTIVNRAWNNTINHNP